MRTLYDIKTEIALRTDEADHADTKAKRTRAVNRVVYLRMIEKYLEGDPSEFFILKEIQRIENKILKLMEGFNPEHYKDATEPLKKYQKEMGIPQLRLQLKALRFIKK